MASALCSCTSVRPAVVHPAGISGLRRPAAAKPAVGRNSRQLVAPRASAIEILQLADAAGKEYGSVDAPSWVLPLGIAVVTLASILSGYLLKPGDDAAKQIQQRDSKSGRWTK